MKKVESVFLAGPDLWFPDAAALQARRLALCASAGFQAVSPPMGAGLAEDDRSEVAARSLYADALAALRGADAVVANLTPWRGPSCDPATAFLAGFAAALAKPMVAYLNVADEEEADPRGRVEALMGSAPDVVGRWRDVNDCEVEDFYLPETVLLWAEARRFFVIVTPEPFEDLTGLEMCLQALQLYAD